MYGQTQIGTTINSITNSDAFGVSIELSETGDVVVVGAPIPSIPGEESGSFVATPGYTAVF